MQTNKPNFKLKESEDFKIFRSKDFNYNFNKVTGYYEQYGTTVEQDPQRNPYGPIIADIEILDMCKGPAGKLCPFCYKSNNLKGSYMSMDNYKIIFDKLPKTITQIAFGADADLSLNPDIWNIMDYTRSQGVIPNITAAEINKNTADKLAKRCGAVAVSFYKHAGKDICYDSIDLLTQRTRDKKSSNTLDHVNMHYMLSKETLPYIDELIEDIKNNPRLKNLNAVVFLSLKQKGRGTKFSGCTNEEFKEVVYKMLDNDIAFGFDSCSREKFIYSTKEHPMHEQFKQMSESCESFSTSIYVNEKGIVYPCSFMEDTSWNSLDYSNSKGWDLLQDEITKDNFLDEVWNSDRALQFSFEASKCATCGRGCQVYEI